MLIDPCADRLRASCARDGILFRFLAALSVCLFFASAVAAADIVKVEEDWELEVATTDSNSTAPQVTTTFSPVGHINGKFATLELNHQSSPDFAPGGLHLLVWDGEDPGVGHRHPDTSVMNSGHEVVRWTQCMRVSHCSLTFTVHDGSSTTWGEFGGDGHLQSSVQNVVATLNGYDPNVSVQNSGVTYAGNRVTRLVLKRVRRYTSDGDVLVDETERVVHEN